MAKLSMIMPAYNAEKTCAAAIESVVNQHNIDIELVIIDDGSKDKTLEILRDYENRYSNIKVISVENGGVSNARNIGLDNATGDYIGFIDSDDLLSDDFSIFAAPAIENNKTDVIIFGYSRIDNSQRVGGWIPSDDKDLKSIARNLVVGSEGLNSSCNKIFKKDIVTSKFNLKKQMGEDLEFACSCIKNAKSIKIIEKELYKYNVDTADSLTKHQGIVLASIPEDMEVLTDFCNAMDISHDLVAEKFYERAEGILADAQSYKSYDERFNYFINDSLFMKLLEKYVPAKKKNIIIRNFMSRKLKNTMYLYLKTKSVLRSIK